MRRNTGLDVVRATAIGLVLLAHWGASIFWWFAIAWPRVLELAGYFGVELFFALSGFLIGRLLLDIIEHGVTLQAWWRFMLRRWLRTVPSYWLCLVVMAVLWPPDQQAVQHALASYGSFTQNLFWLMPADNWFGASWSLTVEEWFYLLFSAALLGGAAFTRRAPWIVIAAFIIVPNVMRWQPFVDFGWAEDPRRVAFLRLDAIAYGVVVAILYRRGAMKEPLFFGIGSAVLIWQWSCNVFDIPYQLHVANLTLTPLACALCLPLATRLHRLPPGAAWIVRQVSLQSYALYLVHLPILDAVSLWHSRYGLPGPACVAVSAVLILGASYMLHHFVEVPVMERRPRQYPMVLPVATAAGS